MSNFKEVSDMVVSARKRAYQKVNQEMIKMYYQIGELLSEKPEDFVSELNKFFEDNHPELKNLDLKNMKRFYKLYKDSAIVEKALVNLSWPINLTIMNECKTMDERIFYVDMCLEEELSNDELTKRIKEDTYKKYMDSKKKTEPNFDEIMKIVDEVLSDGCMLEYINKQAQEVEDDIKESVLDDLLDFVLKNNKNITLIRENYETDVDNFIDILFQNQELSCLVALDLKIGKYKQEYIKNMLDNLEYLDNYFDKSNPSVGIIICMDEDDEIIEYLYNRKLSPSSFVKYDSRLIDKELLKKKLKEYRGKL